MTLYALVPVRVKIESNSASEIARAHKVVQGVVDFWQEACTTDWNNDEDGDLQGAYRRPMDMPEWVDPRDPIVDPIEVKEV